MGRYGQLMAAGLLWQAVCMAPAAEPAKMAAEPAGIAVTDTVAAGLVGTVADTVDGTGAAVETDTVDGGGETLETDTVAEPEASPGLYAVGRVKPGANYLRWAPDGPEGWERLLRQGVVVERYAYVADTVLFAQYRRPPLSSADSVAFAEAVAETGDAWIAAMGELLFADSLEIGPGGGRFSRLSQEREQRQMRLAMALLVSDRSYAAACAGLLGWRDSLSGGMKPGASSATGAAASAYLYRIYVPDAVMDTAVVLLRPQDGLLLPPRALLSADFRDRTATLRWDSRLWRELCVGYYVERAVADGPFTACHTQPIDVLQRDRQGADMLYYTDSLPGGQPVRYRVMGVDLFGERYQVTGEAAGAAEATGLSSPEITQVTAAARGGVELRWTYPPEQEKALSRFEVFVKDSLYGAYRSLGTTDPKTRRLAVPAGRLRPSAYFCVAAYNRRGEVCYSAVRFHQEKDTTPPMPPLLPVAYSDTGGGVQLSWRPSPSDDVAGYFVLKSRRPPAVSPSARGLRPVRTPKPAQAAVMSDDDGLPWQLHTDPIADTVYTDSLDALLWQAAYYYIVAVDHNGNLSERSEPIKVYPNRPNPMSPPLFDGCEADGKQIKIRWFNSMDTYAETVALYVSVDGGRPQLVTRRTLASPPEAGGRTRPAARMVRPAGASQAVSGRPVADSAYYALPQGRAYDTRYGFTLAVERPAVAGAAGDTVWAPNPCACVQSAVLTPPRLLAWPDRVRRCVALQWQSPPYAPVVEAYIYRQSGDGPYRLLQVLTPPELLSEIYVDRTVRMNTVYHYRLQFKTGAGAYSPFGSVSVTY